MSTTYGLRFIISTFAVSFALLFAMGFLFANAQEEITAEEVAAADAQATELVEQDENITPEDLGVGDPNILPGNPLYFFKDAFRGLQSFITFDPADKAELRIRFANEKLIEAKKLEEGGASDERVKAALENYEEETVRVKEHIENLKDSGKTKAEIERIVKHTADSQIKHHKALGKMMKRRNDIAPDIEIKKAAAMKHFSEAMATVVDPEILAQKFEEALQEQKGSAFRHFKHIEVLEEVRDFVPAQAKDAIKNAIERSAKAFEEEFKAIEEDQRKIFNKYIEKTGGNEVRHLEVFNSLGAFADIEKEMFQEIEKAREKSRTRIEYRMTSIKDETRKQVFVAHLQGAELEDLRIIKELEANLDPEVITGILAIKHKMEETMRARFENAESTGDLEDLFSEMDDFHDVAMLGVLDEMEQLIPEDKKEFWQEMKKKAMSEMQQDIDEARRFGRLEDELQMLAGFDPEHMTVLDNFQDEFGTQFDFFDAMREEQAERIQSRFEHFREFADEAQFFPPPPFFGEEGFAGPEGFGGGSFGFDQADFFAEAEKFRIRIEQDERIRDSIEQFAPGIIAHFREFDEERNVTGFSDERLGEVIRKAEELVQELSVKLAQQGENSGKDAARNLYNIASAHLADATTLRGQNRSGEAFGKATSAKSLAANGLRHLENAAFQEERGEYFDERDKFRDQFRDLPRDERPNPSQFLKFVPKSFPIFEPPPGFELPDFGPRDRDSHITDPDDRPEDRVCAQVITPARNRFNGSCITFPDSCIPHGWDVVATCEFESEETKPIFDDFQFRKVPEFGDDSLTQPLPTKPERRIFRIPFPTPEPVREGEDQKTTSFFDFPQLGLPFEKDDDTTSIIDQPLITPQEDLARKFLEQQRLLDEQKLFDAQRLEDQRLLEKQRLLEQQ